MNPRILPRNEQAERLLTGGILHDGRHLVRLAHLPAADFYAQHLGLIWRTALDLLGAGQPIDPLSVSEALRQGGQAHLLSAHGDGLPYELAAEVGTASPEALGNAARIVRDTARVRRVIFAASQIVERGYADLPIDDYVTESMVAIADAIGDHGAERIGHIRPEIGASIRRLEERFTRREAVSGIPTGIVGLDEILGGLQAGDYIVISGPSGGGKTSLCSQFLLQCMAAVPSLFFSLEMSKEAIADRLLIQHGRLDGQAYRTSGVLGAPGWLRLSRAAEEIAASQMYLCDQGMAVDEACNLFRRWHLKMGSPKRAIGAFDYLQLIEGHRSRTRDSREQELAYVSRRLKALTRQTGCTVIAMAQLNDDGLIRECRAIKMDSDVHLRLSRETDGCMVLDVEKQRNGPEGKVRLIFEAQSVRFRQHTDQSFEKTEPKKGKRP